MKTIKLALAILLSIAITSCSGGGGSDSSSTPTTATTATGYFIDSAVQGLSYVSGGQSGTTDADGKFTYEVGKTVRFYIGNIVLGEVTAKGYMTPVDLVANADASNTAVLNVARFLMTLDSDNNPDNGITISDATRTAAQSASTIDFSTATDTTLTSALTPLTTNTLVTSTDAQTHLTGSIYGLYAGTYSGTFLVGTKNTTLTVTIGSDGAISGTSIQPDENYTSTISGQVASNGTFTGIMSDGVTVSGTIDASTGILSASGSCSECSGGSVSFTLTKQTTATASDFVGTWTGSYSTTSVYTNTTTVAETGSGNLTMVLALSNDSLTGTLTDSNALGFTSTLTGITVTNGTLSVPMPNTQSSDPDCANWNVTSTATLDSSLTSMNLSMSGTVCSDLAGGEHKSIGTFSSTLTKQ